MAQTLLPVVERALCVPQNLADEHTKAATPFNNQELRPLEESGGGGNRTRVRKPCTADTSDTEATQIRTKSRHINALPDSASPTPGQKPTLSEHQNNTSLHQKCATCVPHPLPDDLRPVVDAWDSLPAAVKAGILAMIQTAR